MVSAHSATRVKIQRFSVSDLRNINRNEAFAHHITKAKDRQASRVVGDATIWHVDNVCTPKIEHAVDIIANMPIEMRRCFLYDKTFHLASRSDRSYFWSHLRKHFPPSIPCGTPGCKEMFDSVVPTTYMWKSNHLIDDKHQTRVAINTAMVTPYSWVKDCGISTKSKSKDYNCKR